MSGVMIKTWPCLFSFRGPAHDKYSLVWDFQWLLFIYSSFMFCAGCDQMCPLPPKTWMLPSYKIFWKRYSFSSEALYESSVNTIKKAAGLRWWLCNVPPLSRNKFRFWKVNSIKADKRPSEPIKFGWNVKPWDGHTHGLVASQAWFIFA